MRRRHFDLLRPAAVLLATLAAGCATDDQIRDAITDVNREFRAAYEQILVEKGSRIYRVTPKVAFAATTVVLQRLSMRVGDQAPELGYLNVFAAAPAPLSLREWQQAGRADLPKLREIAMRHVGPTGYFIKFEPEGLETVINATALEVPEGTEISFTVRLREVAPPKSGYPRREYLPPTAVRMGLDKIWDALNRELGPAWIINR
jgi:hypothetical protein